MNGQSTSLAAMLCAMKRSSVVRYAATTKARPATRSANATVPPTTDAIKTAPQTPATTWPVEAADRCQGTSSNHKSVGVTAPPTIDNSTRRPMHALWGEQGHGDQDSPEPPDGL